MTKINRLFSLCLCLFSFSVFADKDWALLLFLNAHNNLDEYGDINLNQLEKVGSSDSVDFIVQWAKLGTARTHRLRVVKDNDENKVTSPFVESLPRVDMGNYKSLVDFVKWSAKKYPAKHYFVAVWNHGSGWHRRDSVPQMRGVSYDDYSGNHITTEQLGVAMKEVSEAIGRKVDIVGMDACLMAMTEVGAEIANWTNYLAASQELEPGLGWPYDKWAAWWVSHSNATSEEVGKTLVTEYVAAYSGDSGITFSIANLQKMGPLLSGLKGFTDKVMSLNDSAFKAAFEKFSTALHLYEADYSDLGNFLKVVTTPELESEIGDLRRVYADVIVASQTSSDLAGATGQSFWVPQSYEYSRYKDMYKKLVMSQKTGWDRVFDRAY